MAASIGVRIALVRSLCRKPVTAFTASSNATSSIPSRVSASAPSIQSGSSLRHPTAFASSRCLRRELSSLLPLHSAVASACLISKLPDDAVSFEEYDGNHGYYKEQKSIREK